MREVRLFALLAALFAGEAIAQEPPPAPAKETAPAADVPKAAASIGKIVSHRDLEYARPDDKAVRLDLFVPEKHEGPLPVVIWIHGGGWQGGSKDRCPAVPFVRDGFAVASVEYRLTDRACFPAQIHDCKAAVRFLRANAKKYNLDPDRFGAWGASAGGHLVALLGTTCGDRECEGSLGNAEHSSAIQCACDWFGPTDFTAFTSPSYDVTSMLTKLFGGKMSDKKDLVRLASPALHVKKVQTPGLIIPPFLIVQGDKDPLVPAEQSRLLSEKLKEAGAQQELVIVAGQGHGFLGESRVKEFERVRDFFVKQLKPTKQVDPKAEEKKAANGNVSSPRPSRLTASRQLQWDSMEESLAVH